VEVRDRDEDEVGAVLPPRGRALDRDPQRPTRPPAHRLRPGVRGDAVLACGQGEHDRLGRDAPTDAIMRALRAAAADDRRERGGDDQPGADGRRHG